MSEKLEKALEELNGLMAQVNDIRKEGMDEEMTEDELDSPPTDASSEVQSMEYKGESTEGDAPDGEAKALDKDEAAENEAGEPVIEGGSPKAASITLKGYENEDFSTLNLSAENVEKAYEQFKAEQLEKIAYDDLQKQFAARFEAEKEVRKESAERAEYDAKSEVAILKSEFAELRKSLTEKDNEIRKAAEVAMSLPDNLPTSIEAAADMSWDEIHNLARGD